MITSGSAPGAEFVKNFDANASGAADLILVINAGVQHVTEFVKNLVGPADLIMTHVERSDGTKVYTTSATSRWTPFS